MRECPPSCADNLQPGMRVWCVELELGCELYVILSAQSFRRLASLTMANNRTWTVAPAPYHHGPLIPYLYPTALLWSKVAAQVQALTIPDAMRPGLTARDAEENSSDERGENGV